MSWKPERARPAVFPLAGALGQVPPRVRRRPHRRHLARVGAARDQPLGVIAPFVRSRSCARVLPASSERTRKYGQPHVRLRSGCGGEGRATAQRKTTKKHQNPHQPTPPEMRYCRFSARVVFDTSLRWMMEGLTTPRRTCPMSSPTECRRMRSLSSMTSSPRPSPRAGSQRLKWMP